MGLCCAYGPLQALVVCGMPRHQQKTLRLSLPSLPGLPMNPRGDAWPENCERHQRHQRLTYRNCQAVLPAAEQLLVKQVPQRALPHVLKHA